MLEEKRVNCPYCGEDFTSVINTEDIGNSYIEDCFICCRPITFIVQQDHDGDLHVETRDENSC